MNISQIGWVVVLALVLATLLEGAVEYIFGTLFDKIPELSKHKWTLMYISLVLGVLLAWFYQIDLIALIANNAGGALPVSVVGIIMSGVVIGRGANFINDFVSRWFAKPVVG